MQTVEQNSLQKLSSLRPIVTKVNLSQWNHCNLTEESHDCTGRRLGWGKSIAEGQAKFHGSSTKLPARQQAYNAEKNIHNSVKNGPGDLTSLQSLSLLQSSIS